jgi:hypothetical protein
MARPIGDGGLDDFQRGRQERELVLVKVRVAVE